MIFYFCISLIQKKRMENKVDQILTEVRGLDLRITVLETRMEERSSTPREIVASSTTSIPAKRGRPRKKPL